MAGAALLGSIVAALPAGAGGMSMQPVRERYEPGEFAVLVGYTIGDAQIPGEPERPPESQAGWTLAEAPFRAVFSPHPVAQAESKEETSPQVELGPVLVEATGLGGSMHYRMTTGFYIPIGLRSGQYTVRVCAKDCSGYFGDLIGGWFHVGTEPAEPMTRVWALNDPALADVRPDSLVATLASEHPISVRDALAGVRPPGHRLAGPISQDLTRVVTYPPPRPSPQPVTPSSQQPVHSPTSLAAITASRQLDSVEVATPLAPQPPPSNTRWLAAAGAAVLLAGLAAAFIRIRRGGAAARA